MLISKFDENLRYLWLFVFELLTHKKIKFVKNLYIHISVFFNFCQFFQYIFNF